MNQLKPICTNQETSGSMGCSRGEGGGSGVPRELSEIRADLSPRVGSLLSSCVPGDESDTRSTHLPDGETEAGRENVLITESPSPAALGTSSHPSPWLHFSAEQAETQQSCAAPFLAHSELLASHTPTLPSCDPLVP